MQKRCTTCGASLDNDVFICPSCGALPDAHSVEFADFGQETEPSIPPIDMTFTPIKKKFPRFKKKFPRWLFGIGIAAVMIVALAFTWKALLMLIAPKAALSLAIENTGHSLQQRQANSPTGVLTQGAAHLKDGKLSINTDVSYEGEQIQAQLDLSFNKERKQTAAGAALMLREKTYKANFYIDPDFAAASADFFQDGSYYGVTFGTFKEDIRKSIVGEDLSDAQIENIDSFIQAFLDIYTLDIDTKELSKPYKQVIKQHMKDLEMEKSDDSISIDNKSYACSSLTYSLSESDIKDLLEALLDTLEDDKELRDLICRDRIGDMIGTNMEDTFEAFIDDMREALDNIFDESDLTSEIVFYVRSGRLICMDLNITVTEDGHRADISAEITFGLKTNSDIVVDLIAKIDNETGRIKVTSKVNDDKASYKETITATLDLPDQEEQKITYATKWNKSSGKLTMTAKAEMYGQTQEASFGCTLNKITNGFELTIDRDDLEDFLLQYDDVELPESLDFTVSIRCTKGSDIAKPQYVNIDQFDETLLQQLQETLNDLFA